MFRALGAWLAVGAPGICREGSAFLLAAPGSSVAETVINLGNAVFKKLRVANRLLESYTL